LVWVSLVIEMFYVEDPHKKKVSILCVLYGYHGNADVWINNASNSEKPVMDKSGYVSPN
jgi:hypothetical protein